MSDQRGSWIGRPCSSVKMRVAARIFGRLPWSRPVRPVVGCGDYRRTVAARVSAVAEKPAGVGGAGHRGGSRQLPCVETARWACSRDLPTGDEGGSWVEDRPFSGRVTGIRGGPLLSPLSPVG